VASTEDGGCERRVKRTTTIGDLLVRAESRDGGHLFVVSETDRVHYSELLQSSKNVARGLLALGVKKGSHVGIYMPNSIRFLEVFFGVSMLGAVTVPIHSRYRTEELRHIVSHGDLEVVCTSGEVAEVDHPARFHAAFPEIGSSAGRVLQLQEFPTLKYVVAFNSLTVPHGFMSDSEFFARALKKIDVEPLDFLSTVDPSDVAMILYTSGTTAHPKGCVHTHQGLVRNAMNMGRTRFFLTERDVFWDPLPMFHVGSLLPLLAVADAGATFLTMSKVDGEVGLNMIEKERATWLFPAFPAVTNAILDATSFESRDLASVRMTMCTGPTTMLERLQSALPNAIQISTYGSTETGGVVVYHLPSDSRETRATTCGTAMDGVEIRIIDIESREVVPAGCRGEILVRGYSVLLSYFKDEVASQRAIDAEGWFHTGDLGQLDEGGTLSYHGRLSDMLKVGGENVSPLEVEAVIGKHSSVAVVQVVACPDDRLGEVVAAFVELKDGCSATEAELIDFCRVRIASFKAPKYVRFVTKWPMSTTKIQKGELRRQLIEELTTDAQLAHHR